MPRRRAGSPAITRGDFHNTATVGSFGAAAAAANLLGLGAQRTATALGIAGTQAAGLKSMFGTMCKPLHAGKAAQNGLLAASLAARGFTSRDDVLECAQGFAETAKPGLPAGARAGAAAPGLAPRGQPLQVPCRLLPDARADRMRPRGRARAPGFEPPRCAASCCRVESGAARVCHIPAPRTGLEAKFSLRLTTAMALAGIDTASLDSYSEKTAADPRLVDLARQASRSSSSATGRTPLAALDGDARRWQVLEARHDSGVPADDLAAQGRRLGRSS